MVAIGCGVAAALLGAAALVYIGRQVVKGRSMVNYQFLGQNHPSDEQAVITNPSPRNTTIDFGDEEEPKQQQQHRQKHRHHHRHHRKYP